MNVQGVGNCFWTRVEVPVELLDGSTRQTDVFDGSNSISFDMKMSVVDKQIEQLSQTAKADLTTSNPAELSTSLLLLM